VRIRYSAEKDGKPVKKAIVYTQNEHGINFSDVDAEAVYITERLRANGFETYIVGGAVRDLILGKKPKDFDIVSAASPARIKKIFRNARIIGHRFRLVHVYFGPKIFEVSTFRSLKDGTTSNTFGAIEEDVQRRDFTLNALFYDPLQQLVVDYVGGMKDIKEKRIRPIIALNEIFKDDPVRMIRAVKYGASTGFKLPLRLRWKIKKESGLLASISPSRLTEEIFKIINASAAPKIIDSLDAAGLYQYLQPRAVELFANPHFRER
jgi:poly(A) polymerase